MRRSSEQHPFPTRTAVVLLSVVAILCTVAVLSATSLLGHRTVQTTGLVVGTAASVWLLALGPLVVLSPCGLMPTVAAYFIGMFVRMVGALGGFLAVTVLARLPSGPILVTLVATYLPLLFAEVAIMGRYLWRLDAGATTWPSPSGAEVTAC